MFRRVATNNTKEDDDANKNTFCHIFVGNKSRESTKGAQKKTKEYVVVDEVHLLVVPLESVHCNVNTTLPFQTPLQLCRRHRCAFMHSCYHHTFAIGKNKK